MESIFDWVYGVFYPFCCILVLLVSVSVKLWRGGGWEVGPRRTCIVILVDLSEMCIIGNASLV